MNTFLSGGMVRSGRIPGRQAPVLDYRMEKYPGKSEVLSATLTDGFVVFGGIVGGILRRMYIAG